MALKQVTIDLAPLVDEQRKKDPMITGFDLQDDFLAAADTVISQHGGQVYRDPVHGMFGEIYLADLTNEGISALRTAINVEIV